jgi:16S rRNA (uracil1498-N3)-methyltransferase
VNLLLIEPSEIVGHGLARVEGRKAQHLAKVLGKGVGDPVRVGELGGQLGKGTIERVEPTAAWVRYELEEDPPRESPVQLVLALPRPPMLRRILGHATALGVKRITLLHTARVEKSFWDSHSVQGPAIEQLLRLGLEQARDTVMPVVELRRRFLPFVEDELDAWAGQGRRLVAQPLHEAASPEHAAQPTTVVVGPEGGLVPFEVERLMERGFIPVSLGPRILRVETAVVALLARLGPR